ncbi:glycerate kinase [Propionibacteriaceae bacterium G1746]
MVATDRYPALTSAQAGAAMATAWAERHVQVAVVPLGNALEGFHSALADLVAAPSTLVSTDNGVAQVIEAPLGNDTESPEELLVAIRPEHNPAGPGIDQSAGTAGLGRLVRAVVDGARTRGRVVQIVLELGDIAAHDGGAGLLGALGASADRTLDEGVAGLRGISAVDVSLALGWLDGATLELVVPSGEHTKHLVGLKGITSVRGHAAGLDAALLLATDQALVDLAAAVGQPKLATTAGAGAAGGVGFAVLALGGAVATGAAHLAARAGLAGTIARADLVVTGGAQLDFGTMGGDVLTTVLAMATGALRPVVVVAGENFISARELRSIGVEAAYSVQAVGQGEPIDADALLSATRPVAASWTW